MTHKVIEYHDQPYGEYQLGFCKVELDGKYRLILRVLKNKAGHLYCAPNSCKIAEDWQPVFYPIDRDYERQFLTECMEQLKPLMELKEEPQTQQVAPIEDNQNVPF